MPEVVSAITAAAVKVSNLVAASWKDIGGAAIAFQALKTFVFGKSLKTIEYPNGELRTIVLRWATLRALKKKIALYNPGVQTEDIQGVAKWMAPHFTEAVKSSTEVRYLNDDSWIVWTRSKALEIPLRFSIDKGYPIADPTSEGLFRLLSEMYFSLDGTLKVEGQARDELVIMAASKDEGLLGLYRHFGSEPAEFQRYALQYLQRRQADRAAAATSKKKRRRQGDQDGPNDDEDDGGGGEQERKERRDKFNAGTETVVATTDS